MGIRIDQVVILRGYSPEADCLPHQTSDAFGLHLLHNLSAIAFNRSHADVKLGGYGVAHLHHALAGRGRLAPIGRQVDGVDGSRLGQKARRHVLGDHHR